MVLPVTAVTVAFGNPGVVGKWVDKWSSAGAKCIIANNGSEIPRSLTSGAFVLPFQGNDGFGAGINRAVRHAGTSVVVITNPDTLPAEPDSLRVMAEFHQQGSFTGARTFDSFGKRVHSTGVWPSVEWVRSQVFRKAGTLWRKDRKDWLQGSLIMAHKDDFLRLEGFSGNYPLYFEDVDLCFRAVKQGKKIDFCSESRFIHDEGSGSERAKATRLSCFHWGMMQFFRDHFPVDAGRVKRIIIAKCILRMLVFLPVDTQISIGCFRACKSILSGVPPALPGIHSG